jgi:hypothetical protein
MKDNAFFILRSMQTLKSFQAPFFSYKEVSFTIIGTYYITTLINLRGLLCLKEIKAAET